MSGLAARLQGVFHTNSNLTDGVGYSTVGGLTTSGCSGSPSTVHQKMQLTDVGAIQMCRRSLICVSLVNINYVTHIYVNCCLQNVCCSAFKL